ncbi:MAG: hypothetical protein EOM25_05715 [Deltaproteobacteria bacterium]|nr:hypothetical protein [Deltaproteobacteria bacterium]
MKTSFSISLFAILLAAVFGLTSGCARKAPVAKPLAATTAPPRAALWEQADQAWKSRDFALSQSLYARLASAPPSPPARAEVVFDRLVRSAIAIGDLPGAHIAHDQWTRYDPLADRPQARLLAEADLVLAQGGPEAWREFLAGTASNNSLPWDVRLAVGRRLADTLFDLGDLAGFLAAAAMLNDGAGHGPPSPDLDGYVRQRLNSAPAEGLHQALSQAPSGTEEIFPYCQARWALLLAGLEHSPASWAGAWPQLVRLTGAKCWSDPGAVRSELQTMERRFGRPEIHLALTLPLSGPFAPVAWKIIHGAGAAQWNLGLEGLQVRISVINTEAPGWAGKVAALPPSCLAIGGPLRRESWLVLAADGLPPNRAFFTFLPSLAEEGRKAWRFFGSPEDQARALIDMARDGMGINHFAILYPAEPFGRTMAESFALECERSGGILNGLKAYDPADHTRWNREVASFLRAETVPKGHLNPEPDFQALFLPDSLSRARLMIPNFFYHNENRILFLGPQIWTQSMNEWQGLEAEYFGLAVSPASWWPDSPSPQVGRLRNTLHDTGQDPPDFWSALGNDFVRFAAALPLPQNLDPEAINSILCTPSAMDWSMAPLSWTPEGLARQDMFVLQPSSTGLHPVHIDSLTARLAARQARRDRQMFQIHPELAPKPAQTAAP